MLTAHHDEVTIHSADELLLLAALAAPASDDILQRIAAGAPGLTLFRSQVDLEWAAVATAVATLGRAGPDGAAPLLALDRDFESAGVPTSFPDNLALGAADDTSLTAEVAMAIGSELRALGCTLHFGPVVDLATNPANPTAGLGTFGDDPEKVAAHAAAFVTGLQSVGVAGCAHYFPGIADAMMTTRPQFPGLDHSRARSDAEELVPLAAAISAGVKAVATSRFAAPTPTGLTVRPGSPSGAMTNRLLRGDLGFEGVVVADVPDMVALSQGGAAAIVDIVAAVLAGGDLLLTTPRPDHIDRARSTLRAAVDRGVIPAGRLDEAVSRSRELRRWVAGFPRPDAAAVGTRHHRALASEVARRAVAVVRDDGTLPIAPDTITLVVEIEAAGTSIDTLTRSGALAAAFRERRDRVRSMVVPVDPDRDDIGAAVAAAQGADVTIVATADAHLHTGQADLVAAILAAAPRVVTVATRTPWDLLGYRSTRCHLATHSPHPDALEALAAVACGDAEASGRSPIHGVE